MRAARCDRKDRNQAPAEAAVGTATTNSSAQAPNLAPNAFDRNAAKQSFASPAMVRTQI
jgi:hypothetical protein